VKNNAADNGLARSQESSLQGDCWSLFSHQSSSFSATRHFHLHPLRVFAYLSFQGFYVHSLIFSIHIPFHLSYCLLHHVHILSSTSPERSSLRVSFVIARQRFVSGYHYCICIGGRSLRFWGNKVECPEEFVMKRKWFGREGIF
jgi:hypothetical protein